MYETINPTILSDPEDMNPTNDDVIQESIQYTSRVKIMKIGIESY